MPLLCYSLSAFDGIADEILVTCRPEDKSEISLLISSYPQARTVFGGSTRSESVYFALCEANGDCVLIHDAARPFLTKQTINNCLDSVQAFGSGICAIPASDTIAIAENENIISVPNRDNMFLLQTPQGFLRKKLLIAFEKAQAEGKSFTDESGLYAAYCERPHLCEGDRTNRKLTYPEDFSFAERVGFGIDTHAFGTSDPFITLAGIQIPSHQGLVAHSDGDVLVHALMDALLSAAGLRDIGYYFPDTDERYRNANSIDLLKNVLSRIRESGFVPQNVSISVLAEAPRLSAYIDYMKLSLSKVLALPTFRIGIAAGTNEKLGYVGEGKGITVYCIVLLNKR